jgi:DNA mismatch endonuclease (patch repair protein)
MDRVGREMRSRIMSSIRSVNTGPEMSVRRALHAAGLRYRIHVRGLPGTPDVVFPGRRLAVFVNGCFWHRCPMCRPGMPKANREFWEAKFRGNAERDRRVLAELRAGGWDVFTVWECDVAGGVSRLLDFLGKGKNE